MHGQFPLITATPPACVAAHTRNAAAIPYFSEVERARGQQLLRFISAQDQGSALQLLSSGATIDVEQISSDEEHAEAGRNSLMLAARYGFGQIIIPLLRAGAQTVAFDFHGSTALMIAAVNAHPFCVHTLMHWHAAGVSPADRRSEFVNAIAKLIDLVPLPSILHASCALLLLHSVHEEAERLWPFFPAKLKEQTCQLQQVLMCMKYAVRSQSFNRFFKWQQFSALHLQSLPVAGALSLVLGARGIQLGNGGKLRLMMLASLLRKATIRQAAPVSPAPPSPSPSFASSVLWRLHTAAHARVSCRAHWHVWGTGLFSSRN